MEVVAEEPSQEVEVQFASCHFRGVAVIQVPKRWKLTT